MCVRTVVGTESSEPVVVYSNRTNKLQKAKEKYMKLHDDMVTKELEIVNQRKNETVFIPELADDILRAGTINYSSILKTSAKYYEAMQQTKLFKILFYTTQPAHVIMIAAVLCVTSALVPTTDRMHVGHPQSSTTSFIYLASFMMHLGAQVWMTFVSGLSLYFALPRHTFGEVQRILFPRYFTINTCLSLTTLLIFAKHHPIHTWDTEIAIQVGGMSTAFFLELLIRLYLTPPLLRLMVQKNTLERAVGVGNEIGAHNPGPLKHCPHYLKIHQAFRRIHVYIAMGNMLTMGCTVLHLHYIASKLCVL